MKNKGYGFVYRDSLPKGDFTEKTIDIKDINWAVTGSYNDIADNHCACVCAVNASKLLKTRVPDGEKLSAAQNDERSFFTDAHRIIKNGPVVFLAAKMNRIFRSLGVLLKCRGAGGKKGLIAELENDRPVALLLSCALFDWHWVLCIGIRSYEDGSEYLNIIDNWNNRSDRYLPVKKRFTWMRALRFEKKL